MIRTSYHLIHESEIARAIRPRIGPKKSVGTGEGWSCEGSGDKQGWW